jgi:hypothetical protein
MKGPCQEAPEDFVSERSVAQSRSVGSTLAKGAEATPLHRIRSEGGHSRPVHLLWRQLVPRHLRQLALVPLVIPPQLGRRRVPRLRPGLWRPLAPRPPGQRRSVALSVSMLSVLSRFRRLVVGSETTWPGSLLVALEPKGPRGRQRLRPLPHTGERRRRRGAPVGAGSPHAAVRRVQSGRRPTCPSPEAGPIPAPCRRGGVRADHRSGPSTPGERLARASAGHPLRQGADAIRPAGRVARRRRRPSWTTRPNWSTERTRAARPSAVSV